VVDLDRYPQIKSFKGFNYDAENFGVRNPIMASASNDLPSSSNGKLTWGHFRQQCRSRIDGILVAARGLLQVDLAGKLWQCDIV
jgi:hypothetical protein